MWYVYESHMQGDLYAMAYEQDSDELYCVSCGDSDSLFTTFETEEEARTYVKKYNDGKI